MWVDVGLTTTGGRTWTLVARHLSVSDGPNCLTMTGPRPGLAGEPRTPG